ncbi:MAG TPA: hypothetical protein VFG32_08100 [Bacteroidota bacterium]|nr:hypothetical protein [Bacteroidota bacterium]
MTFGPKRVLILVVTLATIAPTPIRSQSLRDGESYVGKAGEQFISEQEFLQRFELLPSLYRDRKSQLETAKLELLYSIIAERLLAQEAEARGLVSDTLFQREFGEINALFARDQLYRDEVSAKVTVTQDEIRNGIAQAQRQILVSFLFFGKEEDARFIRSRIRTVQEFDRLRLDSTMLALRDTATVIWGNAEPAVEEAAYVLKPGEVSPVIMAGNGYYIFVRTKVVSSKFFAGMQPGVLREYVAEKIRVRKERVRASEFVDEILRDKVGYARPEPFKLVARAFIEVFGREDRDSLIILTLERSLGVRKVLGATANDTLVVAGNTVWTCEQVIDRLMSRRFALPRVEVKNMPPRLNGEIKLMVQQELLGQEALRRGLDGSPEVRRQLEMWRSAYLAEMIKGYVADRVIVSDAEVYAYLKSRNGQEVLPRVQLRELQTGTLEEMRNALADLESGISWENVVTRWSNDENAKSSGGVTPPFAITARPPLGEIAGQMRVGERYGPLRAEHGVIYFELLKKESFRPAGDTSFTAAREDLLRRKQRRTLTLFLAQIGGERGFATYQDRLSKLKVSPIPMMTFRYLGFGGRMLAVPFVQPLIDWLEVEPPTTKIFP